MHMYCLEIHQALSTAVSTHSCMLHRGCEETPCKHICLRVHDMSSLHHHHLLLYEVSTMNSDDLGHKHEGERRMSTPRTRSSRVCILTVCHSVQLLQRRPICDCTVRGSPGEKDQEQCLIRLIVSVTWPSAYCIRVGAATTGVFIQEFRFVTSPHFIIPTPRFHILTIGPHIE